MEPPPKIKYATITFPTLNYSVIPSTNLKPFWEHVKYLFNMWMQQCLQLSKKYFQYSHLSYAVNCGISFFYTLKKNFTIGARAAYTFSEYVLWRKSRLGILRTCQFTAQQNSCSGKMSSTGYTLQRKLWWVGRWKASTHDKFVTLRYGTYWFTCQCSILVPSDFKRMPHIKASFN